ncbi:GntR family transcriptional regulator [Pseudotabrizicola alkalilacus]|uniref:GntR family transcriptional regulator n=1 Tax=Pseudotabrizicola alkalilacus TaxID=2305252 RepID=A0A411YWT9_9RHOB|nr:GntR family transcriptional regulator [Pseudotabrizicola alkalilacus]RGP35195.1 GntR family transcriptional regulator [Pseudotabrizicola alkalilacus]
MLDPDANSPLGQPPAAESKNSFALARLRRAFITCELLPGASAAEAEIAERFHLGRASVRSALARLEVEGFVHVAPRSGWQVAPITAATVGDVAAAWRLFAHGSDTMTMEPTTARKLSRIAAQADALLGRSEPDVVAVARVLWRTFITDLAAAQGALVAGWMAQCNDLTQRLIFWFERSNARWAPPPLTPIAEALVANDMKAAAAELERSAQSLRDWLIECLIRAEDIVLTPGIGAGAHRLSQPAHPPNTATATGPGSARKIKSGQGSRTPSQQGKS